MIGKASTVLLMTDGERCRATVLKSVMSAKKLRSILLKYGGQEAATCYLFENKEQYLEVKKELQKTGAYLGW